MANLRNNKKRYTYHKDGSMTLCSIEKKFPEVKTVSTLILVCPKYIGWARKFKERNIIRRKELINLYNMILFVVLIL